jgi:hypothetical protein
VRLIDLRYPVGFALGLALLLGALGSPAEAKRAKLRCDAGVTLFVEGKLRIFGVPYRTPDEHGYEEYACLGAHGRPLSVGDVGADTGVGSGDTPMYAFGGGRYLGTYDVSDGEGGPSASFQVYDLKTRRSVAFTNSACCEGVSEFRVAANGALITDDGQVDVRMPRTRGVKTLSTPGVSATDLALAGNTVYWTEHPDGAAPAVRSAALDGVTGSSEARALEPVRPRATGGACTAAKGTTIVASSSVRVYERTKRGSTARLACRIGGARNIRIGSPGAPVPRIVNDRWLLSIGKGRPAASARVIDMKTGETVSNADTPGVLQTSVLTDGKMAWIEDGGRLLAQRPHVAAQFELAPASAAPTALAASRRTVYWTAGGAPHSARL